jgi:hypothetical protein
MVIFYLHHSFYLELLCKESLHFLPHLFIHSITYLYQYRFMDIYFVLQFKTPNYHYFIDQTVPEFAISCSFKLVIVS